MVKYNVVNNSLCCVGGKYGDEEFVFRRFVVLSGWVIGDWIKCFVKFSFYLFSKLVKYFFFKLK